MKFKPVLYGANVTHRPDLVDGSDMVHGADVLYSASSCGRTQNLALIDLSSSPNLANLFCSFGQFTSFLWDLLY